MLDFCAEHGIVADVEVIPIQKINEAYDRMLKSDVKYRFSIDLSSLSAGRRSRTPVPSPAARRADARSPLRRSHPDRPRRDRTPAARIAAEEGWR